MSFYRNIVRENVSCEYRFTGKYKINHYFMVQMFILISRWLYFLNYIAKVKLGYSELTVI